MIIPIIYPSSGEFWLNSDPDILLGYSFNNRRLTDLPQDYKFTANSEAAIEVAKMLNLNRPLTLTSPHQNYKRRGPNCVIQAHPHPFPPKSFVNIKRGLFDIYIASPELTFLLAARTLDFVDLVKFGYDLCALYYQTPASHYGQVTRTSYTFTSYIREYLTSNRSQHSALKALKALRSVCDFSNSPMETSLAMFSVFPENIGGCELGTPEMNKVITLTPEGKRLTGCDHIRPDMVFEDRVAVEYNSNAVHLNSVQYNIDMNRQTAISLAGYDYIAITAEHIKNLNSLENVMNAIRFSLGKKSLSENNRARTELFYRLFR